MKQTNQQRENEKKKTIAITKRMNLSCVLSLTDHAFHFKSANEHNFEKKAYHEQLEYQIDKIHLRYFFLSVLKSIDFRKHAVSIVIWHCICYAICQFG